MSTEPDTEATREALRAGVVDFLTAQGFKVATPEKTREVLIQYFNVKKRSIRPGPRSVERAKSFDWSTFEPAVTSIQRELEAGADMAPRLSRRLAVKGLADEPDDLLNDWRLQHLHLAERQPDGSVPGGNEILVAWVDESRVLFVGVITHGEWGDIELLTRLADEWPEVARSFQLPGASSATSYSDADRILLRRNGVSALSVLPDGTVLVPPGGGIATSRDSVEAVMQSNAVMRATRIFASTPEGLQRAMASLGIPSRVTQSPLRVEVVGLW